MAKSDKTANILLKYSVDSASVNRVSSSFDELVLEIEDLNSELAKMGRAGNTGVSGLMRELPKAESGIESLQSEVIRLRKELLALDDVNVSPTVTVQGAGGSGVAGLDTVDQLGRIGSQIGGGLGGVGGEVGNVVNLVGDIAGSIATLNPVLIAGAAAIGGLSLALSELKRYSDAAAEATRLELEGRQAAEAQIDASPLDKIDRINAIIAEVAAAERNIATRQAEIDQRRQEAAQQFGLSVNDVIVLGLEPLEASINDSKDDITTLTAEFLALNAGFDIRATRAFYEGIRNLQHAAESVSPVLSNIAEGFSAVADKARTLPEELRLAGAAEAARKAQAAQEAQALQVTRSTALFESVNATVKAQEALISSQNAYNAAIEASSQRITELNAKMQADLAEAGDDRRTALVDAERDAGEQRVKIAEDNGKEIERIQKRFTRSYEQAVGDRDALAAARAEQQRDDELKDLDSRYKDQNKALDDNLKNQQRTIEQRYDAQVRTIRAAADASIRLEQQRAQAEINLKAQSVQAAQVALVNAQQAEYLIRANFHNQTITQATAWANQMHFLMAYGLTVPGGTTNNAAGQGRVLPTRATGGPVTAGQPYLVGERGQEIFIPNVAGTIIPNHALGGGGLTINVVGAQTGTIRATSKAQAIAVFDKVLSSMGAV